MGELVFGIGREQSCSWPTIQISRKNWDSFMPSLQLSCNSPYHLCVCPMWHHWIADLFVVFHDITVRVGTLLVWSTVYKCAKANGDRIKVTWFIVVSKLDVRRPISRAGCPPPRVSRLSLAGRFPSEIVSQQIWRQMVKTRGSSDGKCVIF